MARQRASRVADAMRQEIAEILRGLKDPRIGFVSVVRVEVTPDLRQAKVLVSVLGPEETVRETMKGLTSATGHVRTELGQRIRLRLTPEIQFRLDTSIAEGARIARMLREVTGPAPLPPAAETESVEQALTAVVETLKSGQRFLLVVHRQPDGDTLGSALGMAAALQEIGKEVVLAGPDPAPAGLSFLAGVERLRPWEQVEGRFDAALVFDCGDLRLTGGEEILPRLTSRLLNIDHHLSNHRYGEVNLVMTEAAAVGEIVARILEEMGVALTPAMAQPLYTSLVTDTGGFLYDNTTAHTHRLAANLLEAGANRHEVALQVFENRSRASLALLERGLGGMQVTAAGRLVYTRLTEKDFQETAATVEDSEGIVTVLRTLQGVEIALLLRPDVGSDRIRVSLRSKERVDVARLAEGFGGGGHARAAGCTLANEAEMERLLRAAEAALD